MCAEPRIKEKLHIDGMGKSFYASTIVVLMMQGWFGNGSTEEKFKVAFERFLAFCRRTGNSTSIYEFSFKALKLKPGSPLVCYWPDV